MSPAALMTASLGPGCERPPDVTWVHEHRSDNAARAAVFRSAMPRTRWLSVLEEVATARVSEAHHQVCSDPGHRSLLDASRGPPDAVDTAPVASRRVTRLRTRALPPSPLSSPAILVIRVVHLVTLRSDIEAADL